MNSKFILDKLGDYFDKNHNVNEFSEKMGTGERRIIWSNNEEVLQNLKYLSYIFLMLGLII
ncbi:MAG: hypothetical protein CVV50_02745 [Spirochaetae bacterium HGW-Spirochaetae-6]|nr:MAG: hypothetical protein CVV50_02745 [Spirochaetae bacterium HGW-Spirochaetae-6]